MKWWKKLLIVVGILAVLGLGLLGYGAMKLGDLYNEKILPDMQAGNNYFSFLGNIVL